LRQWGQDMDHPVLPTEAGREGRRTLTIDRNALRFLNAKARTVEASISSEAPYRRWEGVDEVLDHSPQAVDLSRAEKGLSLLLHHDPTKVIGIAENFRLGSGRLRCTLRFGQSADAEDAWKDVEAGVLRHISIGYEINEAQRIRPDTVSVTRWTPHEVSLVSIPADITVGIGRSHQISKEMLPMTSNNQESGASGSMNAERARVADILALGRRFNVPIEAENAVRDGTSIDQFRSVVMEKMDHSNLPPNRSHNTMGFQGLSARDRNEVAAFSLGRAIAAHITGNWSEAGLERDVSTELARQAGKAAEGFFVPSHALAKRTTMVATGNALVGTDTMESAFINALVNRAMVMTLGATRLSGLIDNVSIPRMTATSSFAWVAENTSITQGAPAFDSVPLAAKQCSGRVAYSKRLLVQGLPSIEQLMINDLNTQIGLAIDFAAIAGTGAANQPRGILSTPGVNSIALGTNGALPTFANMVQMETEVAVDNADIGSLGYLTNSRVRGRLKTTEKAASTGMFVWEGVDNNMGRVNGYRAGCSNHVPSNLTKGSSNGVCSAIIFGNWADLLIGEWGAVDMVLDPYSDGASGNVRIYAHAFVDVNVRNPQSFTLITDALTV